MSTEAEKTFLVYLVNGQTLKIKAQGIGAGDHYVSFNGDGAVACVPTSQIIAVVEESHFVSMENSYAQTSVLGSD